MSFFVAGAPIATSQRFGGMETDVFSIGSTGQIGVSWVTAAGAWQQPLPLCPINTFRPAGHLVAAERFGAPQPQTILFAVDTQGALNYFYAGAPGSSYRRAKRTLPNTYPSGAPLAATGHPNANARGLANFGVSQIDIFVIGMDGGLDVHHSLANGPWDITQPGPRNITPPGTMVAAGTRTIQRGLLREAVEAYAFFVDNNGALNAYSAEGQNEWQRQVISPERTFPPGTSLAVSQQVGTDQLDVFAVDDQGSLNVFYTTGAGWVSQKIRPDIVLVAGTPVTASQQFITGVNQTNLIAFDPAGKLNIFSVQGAGAWNWQALPAPNEVAARCALASSRQFGSPNNNSMQLDVFFIDDNNALNIFWVVEDDGWQNAVLADQARLPLKGIGSNANIELHNNCANILGLEVSILITETIVANDGVAFQLNCQSASGHTIGFQQYIFTIPPGSTPPALKWQVNNFDGANNLVIDDGAVLLNLPPTPFPSGLIPAGYRLVIQPTILGPVLGAIYTVYDAAGNQAARYALDLFAETTHTTNQPVTVNELAPIIGFQLDIVGWMNAASTLLISGAGVITYTIPPGQTVAPLDVDLDCLNSSRIGITVETSNVSYQTMAVGKTGTFTQAFQGFTQ
jgi:hypothetical protein